MNHNMTVKWLTSTFFTILEGLLGSIAANRKAELSPRTHSQVVRLLEDLQGWPSWDPSEESIEEKLRGIHTRARNLLRRLGISVKVVDRSVDSEFWVTEYRGKEDKKLFVWVHQCVRTRVFLWCENGDVICMVSFCDTFSVFHDVYIIYLFYSYAFVIFWIDLSCCTKE